MKKLFFFAVAAVALLASCQKTEIGNAKPAVDDSKPAAIQFSVNAPSFKVQAKSAVENWDATNGTPVFIYGLQQERDDDRKVIAYGQGMYDFSDILINNQETKVFNETDKLELYQLGTVQPNVPYFYGEDQTYDFFGYHLGGAVKDDASVVTAGDKITFDVTIDGSNDIMVAAADKAEDIKAGAAAGVTEADAYSAWAARRNVHPNLVFNHALTRFNFIVRGMNAASEEVIVDDIKMVDVATKGKLTVVGDVLGFAPAALDADATKNVLTLKTIDAGGAEVPFVNELVVNGNTDVAGNGACLMVAPNLNNIKVVMDILHDEYPDDVKLDPYEFTVNATEVLKNGNFIENHTKFLAGHSYNIYINVYGPEEIIITAELTAWKDGGDYTYDPDSERPGGEPTGVKAERSYDVATKTIHYAVRYSADITAIQGAIAKDEPAADSEDWKTLVDRRALTGISYELQDGENEADFKLYVRYTTAASKPAEGTAEAWEKVTIGADGVETDVVADFLYVYDEASYKKLPQAYLDREGCSWEAYEAAYENYVALGKPAESGFNPLPWMVVLVNTDYAGQNVTLTMTKGETPVTFAGSASWATVEDNTLKSTVGTIGMFSFTAEELGTAIEAATWTVNATVGEVSETAQVVVE